MKTDAVILAALPKERQAIIDVLESKFPRSGTEHNFGGRDYRIHRIDEMIIAVPQPMGMGQTHAALATADMLTDLTTKIVVLSGIAGCMGDRAATGHKQPFMLGDIVVSDSIIDYTLEKDKEQAESGESGANRKVRKLEPRPMPLPASGKLASAVRGRQQQPDSNGNPDRYVDEKWAGSDIEGPPLGEGGKRLPPGHRPAIHLGSVLSGNSVMASELGKRELLNLFTSFKPDPIAIEMEAAGVLRRLNREAGKRRPEFVMVKAFCDWAEGTKDDAWQAYCSRVSALYALHLILDEKHRLLNPGALDTEEPEAELHEKTKYAIGCYSASMDVKSKVLTGTSEAVRNMAVKEISNIHKNRYKVDLGTNEQFLIRAEPFFRFASRVYATSIDTVSTFWTDAANREDAKRYLACQEGSNKEVARLFVFSTPDNAHRHGKVLDANFEAYGKVFVCSFDHYRRLLREIIAPQNVDRYLTRDFALLEYPDEPSLLAALDHRFLRLDPLQSEGRSIHSTPTKDFFDKDISNLKPGDFSTDFNVLRWTKGYWKQTDWPAVLGKMFEARKADVFHTVSFDITAEEYREIRAILAEIKYYLLQGDGDTMPLGLLFNIKHIWLTQRIIYGDGFLPRDGLAKGRLRISPSRSRRYMLMMQFGSREDLDGYYGNLHHARLRRELYEKLDPRSKQLLDRLEDLLQSNDPDHRVDEQYEVIEDLLAHKIHRLDYFEDELIEHMVKSQPIDF